MFSKSKSKEFKMQEVLLNTEELMAIWLYRGINININKSAIGDFDFKKNTNLSAEQQAVTVFPDIIEHQLEISDEFIVVACDGIVLILIMFITKVFGIVWIIKKYVILCHIILLNMKVIYVKYVKC